MRKYFITGIVILFPLVLTLWLFLFAINFLTNPFLEVVQSYLLKTPWFNHYFPDQTIRFLAQGIILIALLFLTLILGFLARWVVVNSLVEMSDRVLHRIPLINKIYKTTKEVVHTLMKPNATAFKEVVMVGFPHSGVQCLGLVTSKNARLRANDELITVFVPATPNPTMGYLVIYRRDQVRFVDFKVEEALKIIVSCGLVYPEKTAHEKEEPLFQ